MTTTATATAPAEPQHPWARWGWVMGAAWLVFLIFPIGSVVDAPVSSLVRVLGWATIAAFGTLYVAGFVRMMRDRPAWPNDAVALAGLVVLALLLSTVIGFEALGLAPYIISFSMFAFRWPVGPMVAGGILAIALVTLAVSGSDSLSFFFIMLPLIFGFTLLVRVLNHVGEQHDQAQREVVIIAERERVARDVHDVLGHSLTAISVKAELAERLLDVDADRARAELAGVQSLAREALAEIRSTVSGLRATRIGDELASARDALTAAGIEADLPADGDAVEVSNRIVLAWALRESVTNVVRHSRARRCVVELGPDSLVVRDDGTVAAGPEGNGLGGLRERVAASGGTVTLEAGPEGHGHVLEVKL